MRYISRLIFFINIKKIKLQSTDIHRVRKKRSQQFSPHNFNTCRHSFVIFSKNHPEDSFYYENRKFIPDIIISLRSDDVIVTSLEKTLSRTTSGIRCNNVLFNIFRKLKRIVVIFAKQHQRTFGNGMPQLLAKTRRRGRKLHSSDCAVL